MSQHLSVAALGLLQIVALVYARGHYSVIAPGTIRSNFKYNVTVSLHKHTVPCKIDVAITGPSYNATKMVEVQPMSTENVEFNVPTLKEGDYFLTTRGVSGITFVNSTKLNYADYKPLIFIQTDKATYKPGDLVQFRVLFLDANTRPAKVEKPIIILINDGAQNSIKKLNDVKPTMGVYTGVFKLSKQPVLGTWNIDVIVDGQNLDRKSFEVAKYVLPKFEVTIETAKHVLISDGVVKLTIRARYTYGKSVKGKAVIKIEPSPNYYGQTPVLKFIEFKGKHHMEFNLAKDLDISSAQAFVPPLKVTAIMEEELTGIKVNATETIHLHEHRYRFDSFDVPKTYVPGVLIKFRILVQNMDGSPVRDTKKKAKLFITPPDHIYRGSPGLLNIREYESNLTEHGLATFEFKLPKTDRHFHVRLQFYNQTIDLSSLTTFRNYDPEMLKLSVKTATPRIGKPIKVEIQYVNYIPYLICVHVARGKIVAADYIHVPKERRSYTIQFTPTFDFSPEVTVYVHFVENKNLVFAEKTIQFYRNEFINSIKINAQPQAKPGEEVQLQIETDTGSFVGLLAVDQSVLLHKSGNDLTEYQIFESLSNYDTRTPEIAGYGNYPGLASGVITMTNAHYPYNVDATGLSMNGNGFVVPYTYNGNARELQEPRKYFPETWIFEELISTHYDNFTLTMRIPDTITSWVVTGFSLNPESGFALTTNPTKIQVFKPFFLSTTLPYSVKYGEVVDVPVTIFNYLNTDLNAEVTMQNIDGEYEFTENPDELQLSAYVQIPSNTGETVYFSILPKKVGQITLKINAVTSLAGDAIQQVLKVEPEGITEYKNSAVFIKLNENSKYSKRLNINLPTAVISDSQYIEFSAVGDLLGPTIKNLDKLVRMPAGCGEQNMIKFVPNLLVLRYLEAIERNMPTIMEKAKEHLDIGYQRELTYKHDDGSYSAFGKVDKFGSTWLTAYVVRSFRQAAKYTYIDPEVIAAGLNFLASKQAPNGSFKEDGKVFDSAHQNELGMTAFVLLAFLENTEHKPINQTVINRGLKYLADNVDQTADLYARSIAALALRKAESPIADKVLNKLQGYARQENNHKWWSQTQDSLKQSISRNNDIEMTSYVLLASLDRDGIENVLPIIRWLISQRNSNGGFMSTQDTVVGLQALISFAEKIGYGSGEMEIKYVSNEGATGYIELNSENSLVLQTHVLPKTTRWVQFTAKGTGSAVLQLSYRYNVPNNVDSTDFVTNITIVGDKMWIIVKTCAIYEPMFILDGQQTESNMVVMEVNLPSGYTADTEGIKEARLSSTRVRDVEFKNSDSTVVVYLESFLPSEMVCWSGKAFRTHEVRKLKPAAVKIKDYYNSNRQSNAIYSICNLCKHVGNCEIAC